VSVHVSVNVHVSVSMSMSVNVFRRWCHHCSDGEGNHKGLEEMSLRKCLRWRTGFEYRGREDPMAAFDVSSTDSADSVDSAV
jgi:hypothetical protein